MRLVWDDSVGREVEVNTVTESSDVDVRRVFGGPAVRRAAAVLLTALLADSGESTTVSLNLCNDLASGSLATASYASMEMFS